MIMQIRRIIALTMATVLMIVTLGRYSFNATGLPKYSKSSLFERIAISFKIGKTSNKAECQASTFDRRMN